MNKNLKKLFPSFSNALIEDINANAIDQSFVVGDVVMRTGQYIKNTILVLSGSIKIYREDADGGEFFMYYLQPGQACAISMICATKNEQSQIMAKVVEDTELVMVPLTLMNKWMMEHRSWYEFVIDTYRSRFEEVLEVVNSIAFKAMDERLEFYLKRHKDTCGCLNLKLSHQEIATDLNTSREVISRLLKKLEQRGVLKLQRNHIEFLK
ncbi:Crp/Fnr family transcriptional regulator [Flavobacterium psychrophilum]|jgi:CRP/FNR family transcriptional regulator|uniref:Crp/Fnr family transcriptional regulator n=1 Tax=Flavobacterium psychrophilum TaxID=96345 RepID=A0A1Z5HI42_FLAPS|nr:Crp/Fnr family transcriptional regulator [Flavobacterium psychrophilum]EKT3966339.1 Crp/Fnr family transcriptional regulator [Flavobacterium psychrophilum]EKT4500489.1 Crp/Fnr family transcriptional regulator [Flavobacterium psychrophilum]EKT4508618.1 Crp/Fnr family transcriptional regulator [Flavobacterium psychrophilum]EKT4520574.1 Crp/Fnr family transcriptional regulator [Flavobacterium psychrophilum]EKT4549607.1 Crp/Fnr family transcriptional regulator [Flavobacterium psychrophilum]